MSRKVVDFKLPGRPGEPAGPQRADADAWVGDAPADPAGPPPSGAAPADEAPDAGRLIERLLACRTPADVIEAQLWFARAQLRYGLVWSSRALAVWSTAMAEAAERVARSGSAR